MVIGVTIFFLMDAGQVNVCMAHYKYELQQSGLLGLTDITHAEIWKIPHSPVITRRLIDIITIETCFPCHGPCSQWLPSSLEAQ